MRRTVATLGTTVLLTGLLAACSGQEPADTGPAESGTPSSRPSDAATESATPSASPSPTVTTPQRPPEMDQENADGAAAAAVYFMELWEYTMTSGDTAEWEAMSGPKCGTCKTVLTDARTVSDENYLYEGGEKSARVITQYEEHVPTGIWPVDVRTTTTPISVTDTEGDVVAEFDHETADSRVEIAMGDKGWVVIEVAPVPEEDR